MKTFAYALPDGSMIDIELSQRADGAYEAVIDDRTYVFAAQTFSDGLVILRDSSGRQHQIQTAASGQDRFCAVDGHMLAFERVSDRRRYTVTRHDENEFDLTAAMPGQVIEILVDEGDEVEAGQTVILLEAMKMELRVKAPEAGFVKLILCAVGEAVERGQRLIELETGD